MNSKVKIIAHYISSLGTEQTETWEVDNTDQAKEFIETKLQTVSQPKFNLTSITKEEENMEFDVTRFEQYNFSYVDIIDYTDGREINKPNIQEISKTDGDVVENSEENTNTLNIND